MINNIDLILPLLDFNGEDDFYHLQVLRRKKENVELGSNSHLIKSYYIKSKDDLIKKYDEIKSLCGLFNARCYINLNRRSFKKTAIHMLKSIADKIYYEEYASVKRQYDSSCGQINNEKDKRWIVDLDGELSSEYIENIINFINGLEPNNITNKILAKIPSKNGLHIITKPFNLKEFRKKYNCDIQKDNPTNLYII